MKKNAGTLFFILFSLIKLFSENTVYEFGPKIDNVLVFTASRNTENKDTGAVKLLELLAEDLKETKLTVRIIIAITDNDTPDLPKTVPVQAHKNTKELITKIHETGNAAVFILSDTNENKIKISAGANRKTSPAWLVQDLFTIVKKQNFSTDFYSNNIILYRLGIINNDTILGEYLDAEIAAIGISSGMDITPLLQALINNYALKGISKKWDRHYNIKNIFGYKIISERILIILILAITFIGLLYTFMFSFVFGKKKEKHIRDLLTLWRVPIFFFISNIFAFYISGRLVQYIFYIRFGNYAAIDLFPLTAVFCKFLFGMLISFSILNFINSKLPRNTFIYAYLTSLSCFINIFIFSSFDLSFSLMFLEIYLLSFISAKFKKIYMQAFFLILNAALLLYYFLPVFFITDNLIHTFFYANNIVAAVFFTPYNLTVNRLILRIKKDTKIIRHKFIFPFIVSAVFFAAVLFIFIRPIFFKEAQKNSFLIYKISASGNSAKLISDFNQEDISIDSLFTDFKKLQTDVFIDIFAKLENYLERSIGEIKITPLKQAAVINILITKENGFPVYEANTEFTADATGRMVDFLSPLNMEEPFTVRFSTEKNSTLHVKIDAWFYGNKVDGISVSGKPYAAGFNLAGQTGEDAEFPKTKNAKLLFKVEKEFVLTAEDNRYE